MVVALDGRPGRPPCTIALHERQARRFLCADRKDLDTLGSDLSRLGVFQSSRGRAFPEERVVAHPNRSIIRQPRSIGTRTPPEWSRQRYGETDHPNPVTIAIAVFRHERDSTNRAKPIPQTT